jgi:hypothetical protein
MACTCNNPLTESGGLDLFRQPVLSVIDRNGASPFALKWWRRLGLTQGGGLRLRAGPVEVERRYDSGDGEGLLAGNALGEVGTRGPTQNP